MTIRRATGDDVTWLQTQLLAFSAFYGTKRSLFPDDASATQILRHLIAEHPFFVAVHDTLDVPVGFIAGALTAHPYNPALRVLSELFWWVDPAYRGSTAGARLLAEFERYGREHADWIVMTLEAKSPVNPATLERRGFLPHERSFLLEV